MTMEQAIRIVDMLSEGYACSLRVGEGEEYHAVCLAALREQEERSKGCMLCYPNKRCGTCVKFFDYNEDGGSDECSATVYEESCAYYKPMPFCPNCGRKLEVEG